MLEAIQSQAFSQSSQSFSGSSLDPVHSSVSDVEKDQAKVEASETRFVRLEPGQKSTGPNGETRDSLELSQEAEEIRNLQMRDQEVRAHEAAHASAGGAYAGAPSYTFERGPDGQTYAVGGEVSIDVSPIAGDPQATIMKAQQVRAAALAPAEPSAQDMKVAQRAQAMGAKARLELAQQQSESGSFVGLSEADNDSSAGSTDPLDPSGQISTGTGSTASGNISRLDIHA